MLGDPLFLKEFREFCVKSWCVESLNFVLTTAEYESIDDEEARRERASLIWATFLAPGSAQELNLDSNVVAAVGTRVTNAEAPADLFRVLRMHVIKTLYEDTFWRFNSVNAKTVLNSAESLAPMNA